MSTNLFGYFPVSINVAALHYRSGEIFQIRGVVVLNNIMLIYEIPKSHNSAASHIFNKLQEIFQEATELLVLNLSAAVLHNKSVLSLSKALGRRPSSAHPVVEAKHPANIIFGENTRVGKNLPGEKILLDWQQSGG